MAKGNIQLRQMFQRKLDHREPLFLRPRHLLDILLHIGAELGSAVKAGQAVIEGKALDFLKHIGILKAERNVRANEFHLTGFKEGERRTVFQHDNPLQLVVPADTKDTHHLGEDILPADRRAEDHAEQLLIDNLFHPLLVGGDIMPFTRGDGKFPGMLVRDGKEAILDILADDLKLRQDRQAEILYRADAV